MRKVTVSRMRERYAQTVVTLRITYVFRTDNLQILGAFVNCRNDCQFRQVRPSLRMEKNSAPTGGLS